MTLGSLPSLGLGGSFSSYTPPTDWGAVVGKTADIFKTALDIRTAIRAPAQSDSSTASSLEQSLSNNMASGDNGGGLSMPVLLIGGGVAVLAIVLALKK